MIGKLFIVLDAVAITFSIIGNLYIAYNGGTAKRRLHTFYMYLVANTIMVVSFAYKGIYNYMFLNIFFLCISVLGICKNIKPQKADATETISDLKRRLEQAETQLIIARSKD